MFVSTLIHFALLLSPYLQLLVDFLFVNPRSFVNSLRAKFFYISLVQILLFFVLFLTAQVEFSNYKIQFSIIYTSVSAFSEVTHPPACTRNLRIVRIISPLV